RPSPRGDRSCGRIHTLSASSSDSFPDVKNPESALAAAAGSWRREGDQHQRERHPLAAVLDAQPRLLRQGSRRPLGEADGAAALAAVAHVPDPLRRPTAHVLDDGRAGRLVTLPLRAVEPAVPVPVVEGEEVAIALEHLELPSLPALPL